ncbi:hypothetical protein HDU81_010466 [Chytriomyces hyalinus]|nr:hypothetical protein HDU81_010466 [Chytriomyces hyalinus]
MSDYEHHLNLPGYGFTPVRDLSASLPSLPSTNQEPYCLHPATDASFDTFFSALYGPLPPTNPTQLSFDSPYLYSMDPNNSNALPYTTPPQPPHLLTRPGTTPSSSSSSYIFPVASPTSSAPPPKVVVHVTPPTPTQHLPLGKFMDGSVLINTRPAAAAAYSTSPHQQQHPYFSQRPFSGLNEKRNDAVESVSMAGPIRTTTRRVKSSTQML